MFNVHCKLICNNCGYREDCSDLFPVEPPGPDEPALSWPRTIVNAHAAWYSPDSALLPYELAGRDLALALSGGEPVYALARPTR